MFQHQNEMVLFKEVGTMRRLSLTLFFSLAVLFLLAPVSARAQWGAGQCLAPGLSASDALASCRDGLNIDPTHPEVLYKIGWALTEMGDHLEAVLSYREAIRNQPNYPLAHFGLGKSLEKLGRFDEAIAAYRKALRPNPENAAAEKLDTAAKKRIDSLSAGMQSPKKEEPPRALAAKKTDRKTEKRRKKAAPLAKRKVERKEGSVSKRPKAGENRPEKRARLDAPKSPKKRTGKGVRKGNFASRRGRSTNTPSPSSSATGITAKIPRTSQT
jgi:tetratricopeptide (TPR) repeat protein